MRAVRLIDLATVIRSKNAGPFELTLDVFFRDEETYRRAKERRLVDPELVKRLYGVADSDILEIVYYDPVRAVKVTMARPCSSGSPDDTDVYGAQQHMPLLTAEVPWEAA
jgi:hypothetical protein